MSPSKRTSTRNRGFDVSPGSWIDRFTRSQGTDSSLLMWGRRPRTQSAGTPDRQS
jgi:hypothetical protein